MSYYTQIATKLKTAIGTTDVATAAGLSQSEWSNYHVFDGGRHYVGGQNRGRVPFVNFWRTNSDYSFDAVDISSTQGGTLESTWNIEIVVGKTSNYDERTNEDAAYEIAQKIIKAIRADYNMSLGNQSIGEVVNHPFGLSLSMEVVIQNTHSDSSK